MTEKRFTQKDEDNWEILDRNKHFAYAHGGRQAEKIIQELNELVETNRELYKDNKQLKQGLNDDLELIGQLQKENEQLKQFKEKVFTWIDKEIARNEEAIKWGKETGADSGSIGFYNHMLKRLQRELKE